MLHQISSIFGVACIGSYDVGCRSVNMCEPFPNGILVGGSPLVGQNALCPSSRESQTARQPDAHGAAGYQYSLVTEVPDHDFQEMVEARSFSLTHRWRRSTSASMLVSLE